MVSGNVPRGNLREENQGIRSRKKLSHCAVMRRAGSNRDGVELPLHLCPEVLASNSGLIRSAEMSFCCCRRPSSDVPEHAHRQMEIALLFAPGACTVSWLNDGGLRESRSVKAPAVIMVAPQQSHACRWEHGSDVVLMYLEPRLHQRLLPQGLPAPVVVSPVAAHDLPLWQLASVVQSFGLAVVKAQARVVHLVATALSTYAVELLGRTAVQPVRCLANILVEKVEAFVAAHLSANICTDDMAAHVEYSVPHFSALFKAAVGITPIEYLFRQRMEKARDLLRSGNYTIGEVAKKVSYLDQANFAKKFAEHHGVTPRQVIGQARLDSAARPKIS